MELVIELGLSFPGQEYFCNTKCRLLSSRMAEDMDDMSAETRHLEQSEEREQAFASGEHGLVFSLLFGYRRPLEQTIFQL